jgi:hypothetical protein
VSRKHGLEAFITTPGYSTSELFGELFPFVKGFGSNCVLLADNCSYHISEYTKAKLQEHELEMVLNVAYYPDLNVIETVFSQIKSKYKRVRLDKIFKGDIYNVSTIVKECCLTVNVKGVKANCHMCLGK